MRGACDGRRRDEDHQLETFRGHRGSEEAGSACQGQAARRSCEGEAQGRASEASRGAVRGREKERAGATPATRSAANGNGGIAGTIRHAAGRAKGPAVAVGAAAAGIAGGLALKSRRRRTTVLGVPVPGHLPSVDPRAMAKAVGGASLQFAKTSKSVSKDIDRAADQAERIGKLLG